MTEPTPLRAWTLPTVHRPLRVLVPIAVLALMVAVPALPGGWLAITGAAAPNGAAHATFAAIGAAPTDASTTVGVGALAPFSFADQFADHSGGVLSAKAEGSYLAAAHLLSPQPAQSTSANFELSGSDCATYGLWPGQDQFPEPFAGTSVASEPGNNQTIVVASGDSSPMYTGFGGVNCTTVSYSNTFFTDGLVSVFRSTDGGHTFSQAWVPVNTSHWGTSTDASYGGVNWGEPSIAYGPNDTVMVANVYINGDCQFSFFTNTTNPGCNNATGLTADWGTSVAVSTNGGTSFGDAEQLSGLPGYAWFNFGSCVSPVSGMYPSYIPETPTIVVNPTNGHAMVTWDVFHQVADATTCQFQGTARIYESVSTNMGVTWSTPKPISAQLSEGASVAIGAGASPQITSVFEDYQNQTAGAGISLAATHTDNDGTSWSLPVDIGGTGIFDFSTQVQYPDGFFAPSIVELAADSSATSPYVGHEYLVWADNQTGSSNAGVESIRMLTSTNNGSSWSSTYTTLTASSSSMSYFEPAISVAPNGDVWITYYGLNTGSGNYNVYGLLSTNGGASWSPQFLITDAASAPGSSIYDIGSRAGVVATTNGAYPTWTDCRNACSTSGDLLDFTANVKPVTLASNAGAVPLTVTTAGSTNTVTTPAALGWDNVSSHTVTAPQYVPDTTNTSDVYGFTGFSGVNTSLAFTTTFTYDGSGTTLMANYNPLPAATIEGTFTPSAGASLKLNSQTVPLSAYNATAVQYKVVVASGISYTFVASAGSKYQTLTHTVLTASGGGIYWYNFSLTKANGTFKGTLTPADAKLTINDSLITNVSANGAFNIPRPWGWYWVNASGAGLTGFSEYLYVNPGVPTVVNPTLYGGWITGTISLGGKTVPGLSVKVDGAPVSVTVPSYTFNQTVLGGFHNITATAPGYNLSTIQDLYVTPGQAASLSITLTNQGWITGSVGPTASLAKVQLHITAKSGGAGNYYPVDPVKGTFNVSLLGNTEYVFNVSASGYESYQQDYNVTPGNATPAVVTLTPSPTQKCTGSSCNNNNQTCQQTNTCTSNPSTPSNNGFPTTDLIIIVVVILLAAVVAAVLLMRGRGGGGAPAEYDEGPGTYQDSATSSMPKLQPDGSFGGPPPPPPQ